VRKTSPHALTPVLRQIFNAFARDAAPPPAEGLVANPVAGAGVAGPGAV
jgi:hypothetical protein